MRRLLPSLFLIGIVMLALVGCPGKGRRPVVPPPKPPQSTTPPAPDRFQLKNGHRITFAAEGSRVWSSTITSGEIDPASGMLTLRGIACQMYQQGRPVLDVTAQTGKAIMQGKVARVSLSGQVVARNPANGMELHAETFRWVSGTDTITATNVVVRGAGLVHRADRVTFTTDLSHAVFTGHARTESPGTGSYATKESSHGTSTRH